VLQIWEDSDDDETISGIFGQIRNGNFDPKFKRKRFEQDLVVPQERKVETSSAYLEDDEDVDTRGDCVMNTTEALYRLTRNDNDKWDEWLIIKVPRKGKKWFYVDYCDGDVEDEFHWLEGPYRQEHLTVEDLLERRQSQPRASRRRRGEAEFRDDDEMDKRDPEGNLLPTFYECCKRQRPRFYKTGEKHSAPPQPVLCYLCHHEVFSDLSTESTSKIEIDASLKAGTYPQACTRPKVFKKSSKTRKKDQKKSKNSATALMTRQEQNIVEEAPLHDLTCVGIDTCSAWSISCDKNDFLDLEIIKNKNKDDQLRGVGGTSGIAGKECLVFYARDIDGKMKALIEPKGFYLENPPAKFRILGQQRMKSKGVCAIQDFDDAGTDIIKCKRSGAVIPLMESGRLLLLQTISYQPSDELKEQLRRYVRFGETTSDTRQSQGVQWQLQAVAPYIPKSRAIEKVLYSDGP
jgi:hypothetical protein